MSSDSRSIQWVVWGGLLLIVTIISGAYVRNELARRRAGEVQRLFVGDHVPGFNLTNQTGQLVTLESLRGQVWLADIIFTRCPGPCFQMTKRMAGIAAGLPPGSPVKLISLTTDPDFDQPAVLKLYGERFEAQAGQWQFLTGAKMDIYRVAVEGLKLVIMEKKPAEREIENDLFIHSTVVALVDKRGRLRGHFDLLSQPDDEETAGGVPAGAAEARRAKEDEERKAAILKAVQTLLDEE